MLRRNYCLCCMREIDTMHPMHPIRKWVQSLTIEKENRGEWYVDGRLVFTFRNGVEVETKIQIEMW